MFPPQAFVSRARVSSVLRAPHLEFRLRVDVLKKRQNTCIKMRISTSDRAATSVAFVPAIPLFSFLLLSFPGAILWWLPEVPGLSIIPGARDPFLLPGFLLLLLLYKRRRRKKVCVYRSILPGTRFTIYRYLFFFSCFIPSSLSFFFVFFSLSYSHTFLICTTHVCITFFACITH